MATVKKNGQLQSAAPVESDVWDLPVRLVHWLLVLCLVTLFVSVNNGWMSLHFYAGYALSALLLFRLLWALVGTTYARFTGFDWSLRRVLPTLRGLATGRHQSPAGHNAAGSWMVLLLLVVLAAQVLSGLVYSDEVFWYGPWFFVAPEWAQTFAARVHPRLPALILALAGTHIVAVLYHRLRLKEPLIGAMVHGRKPLAGADRSAISCVWLVLSLLVTAAWGLWLLSLPI